MATSHLAQVELNTHRYNDSQNTGILFFIEYVL